MLVLINPHKAAINIIMSGQTKPLYEIERKLEYKRHLMRLQQIGKQRSKRVLDKDPIREMHRLRNHSMHFHTQKHVELLNQQNQKIINKLMHIAKKRKSNSYFREEPKMIYYQNPARKRLKQEIEKSNIALAGRILAKHSEFQSANQKRMIDQYEKTKKMLERNKRPSLPQFQEIAHSRSVEKLRVKESAFLTLDDKEE